MNNNINLKSCFKNKNNTKISTNNSNNYISFIPNNKKIINKLINDGVINHLNINSLDAKIISKNNKYIYIGFGIFSNMSPFYKEHNSKIKWISTPINHIPNENINNSINQIIKFDISSINKDFNIKKRIPIYPSINDDILLKINENYIDDKQPQYIKDLINTINILKKDGLKCKVLTYNLWDPCCSIENIGNDDRCIDFKKSIPGSIILGSGKWNKYKIPFNKLANQYEFLSHNIFPISNLLKQDIDYNYIFYINNKDLFYFNFYILK